MNKASVAVRLDTKGDQKLHVQESLSIHNIDNNKLKKDNTEDSFMPVENLNISRNVAASPILKDEEN